MSLYICLALCAVAVSLSSVYAGENENAALREAIETITMECAKEHGVSEAELIEAKESQSTGNFQPCFFGCFFKKFDIINDKGEYELQTNIALLKKFVKNEEHFAILSDIAKKCESVNAVPVTDGAAGCERAVLLTKCYMEHKSEFPMDLELVK